MNRKLSVLAGVVLFFGAVAFTMNSCVHAPYVMPESQRTNDPTICFERDILPIFVSNCAKSGCHSGNEGEGGYILDNYAHIVSKGIVPGNIAASNIWESIAMHTFNVQHMPIQSPDLTGTQLDLIKRWIIAGATDSGACANLCDSTNYTFSGAIQPMIEINCLGCHNSASANGGSLADYASIKNAAVNGRLIGDIKHAIGYNAMPLGGIQLSDCQVAQVTKWVAAGAPNN